MTVTATVSSDAGLTAYTGTLQEVLDALTAAGHMYPQKQAWTYNDTGATFTCVVSTGTSV